MTEQTVTRTQFQAMSPHARRDHIRAGCAVTDDPPPDRVRMPKNAISRIEWDRLSAADRAIAARTKQVVDTDGSGFLL
jgi:hypothetical protein